MNFTFRGKANNPPPEFDQGFDDCLNYGKTWYSKFRIIRGTGWYSNGWAEGNITNSGIWYDYWKSTLIGREN